MPMPPYTVRCYERGCPNEAVYKIAARWSDGITSELKTYGLTCAKCLSAWFYRSVARQKACRRATNEILDSPGIYRLERGQRDVQLQRQEALEVQLLAALPADA
jgi:hypothetical protein